METVTSVNPRSRPRGAGKHALPLPLQVTSLSGKQTAAGVTAATAGSTAVTAGAAEPCAAGVTASRDQPCPGVQGVSTNPFIVDTFHQDSGPGSLDPRQIHAGGVAVGGALGHRRIASADTQTFHSLPPNKDNPFLTTCPPPVPGSNGSQSELTKKVGGWNPFGDTQSFGAVTEDAIFGQEFDKLRTGGSSGQAPRRDPFGSAPFTVQEKNC